MRRHSRLLYFVTPRYTIRSGLLEAEGLKPSYAPQTPQSRTAVEQAPGAGVHHATVVLSAEMWSFV